MDAIDAFKIFLTASITGSISTISTLSALKFHINYLREAIERHETAIIRAHDRIDNLERQRK